MAVTKQNYGIKISNPSYNAQKAADYQLAFNSSWPSIAIAFETTVVGVPSGSVAVIPHKLGFIPFTHVWLSVAGKFDYAMLSSLGSFAVSYVVVDDTNVYVYYTLTLDDNDESDCFGNQPSQPFSSYVLHVKCYNLDLTKSSDYTFVQPATAKEPYDNSYGLKVVKEGRSIHSDDLRDFIIHTRGQSPAVLSVLTENSSKWPADPNSPGNMLISYTNPAGYVAWLFGWEKLAPGFIDIGGSRGIAQTGSNSPGYLVLYVQPVSIGSGGNITGQATFNLSVPIANGGTMVVLRDPVFAPTTTFVSY